MALVFSQASQRWSFFVLFVSILLINPAQAAQHRRHGPARLDTKLGKGQSHAHRALAAQKRQEGGSAPSSETAFLATSTFGEFFSTEEVATIAVASAGTTGIEGGIGVTVLSAFSTNAIPDPSSSSGSSTGPSASSRIEATTSPSSATSTEARSTQPDADSASSSKASTTTPSISNSASSPSASSSTTSTPVASSAPTSSSSAVSAVVSTSESSSTSAISAASSSVIAASSTSTVASSTSLATITQTGIGAESQGKGTVSAADLSSIISSSSSSEAASVPALSTEVPPPVPTETSASIPSDPPAPSSEPPPPESTPTPEAAPPASDAPSSSTSIADPATANAAEQQAAVVVPGQKLSVLPIGLGVFGGLAALAILVVGFVTYERRKYRRQFRLRRAAEAVQAAIIQRKSRMV